MEIKIGTVTVLEHLATTPWSVQGFRISAQRSQEIVGYLRAEGIKVKERKNRQTTIEFTVTRTFTSIEDAEVHILEHDLDVPEVATVRIMAVGFSGNRIYRYLENAGVSVVDTAFVKGKTIRTSYRIAGGKILRTNPSNIT